MNFDELNFGDFEPVGNTSDNYTMSDPYTSFGYKGESGDFSKLLSSLLGGAKNAATGKSGTAAQLASLGGIGALLNSIGGGGSGGFAGYRGGIPKYTASRTMNPIPQTVSAPTMQNPQGTMPRRPGSGGVTYFSPMVYTPQAAPVAPVEQVTQPNPTIQDTYAAGGIASLGGYSDGGQLLRGPGDGVSDDIPATIGGKQPARLADGEFVVPARIVSELGNGSTEAGARKLYAMMDRIKKARSKSLKNIAANSKADKYLPA
jgi:hypothetical protein